MITLYVNDNGAVKPVTFFIDPRRANDPNAVAGYVRREDGSTYTARYVSSFYERPVWDGFQTYGSAEEAENA